MTLAEAFAIAKKRWGRFAFAHEIDGQCTVGVIDYHQRRYVVKGTGKCFRTALGLRR